MWALRRAVTLARRSHSILGFSRSCYAKLDSSNICTEHGVNHDCYGCFATRNCLLPSTFSPEVLSSTGPFSGSRSFTSQASKKVSGDEDDLEDGFSELETPDENDKAAGEGDAEHLASDLDLSEVDSEDDSVEANESAVGFSDIEIERNDDKRSLKKSWASPLFKVIMEAPRLSVNNALDKWVSDGNTLGRSEIVTTIHHLRRWHFYLKALQLFEWLEANKCLDFVERDYASRLDLIAKVHGLFKAEKYIEQIPESCRGELVYRTLLANCVSGVKVDKAEEVFKRMRDLSFPVTDFACNQLLLLYKRVDQKKIAEVLSMMEKENVKPTLFTYKLLIDTKGLSNDIDGMEKVVESMKNQGLKPDLTIQAMITKHYLFSGFSEKAAEVLKEMEGDNIHENRGACKSLLLSYASLGKEGDVERIWKVCEANPRLNECLAAIKAWGKLGHVENAEAVFEKMYKQYKRLSPKYYNSLLKVYANHKLLAKGKDLLKRMSESGCRIGPLTWDTLVYLYVQAGEVEKADSILQKAALQNQAKPLYASYLTVMENYVERGDVHNAEKIFHRLRQSGYVGRMGPYRMLLQAYINARTPAYGFRERMKADNIFPNKAVAALLVTVDAFRKT